MAPSPSVLGVDIGGTFTDFVLVSGGQITQHKRLTTPDDPARALLAGVEQLRLASDAVIVHGSTIATNALLERKGARTAFIATRGFADIIEIGRQNRPDLYALVPTKPPPLVPPELRFEVDERVAADGSILTPLDPESLPALVEKLRASGVESVAVCLLFSFLRPEHEQMIGDALRPDFPTSLSCEILPEYREYERASTTVINAAVSPLMARYLDRLEESLGGRRLRIMQSSGGVISTATARQQAARTALSGPAGGALGAFHAARQAGFDHVISFDMGGTSTDVTLLPGSIPHTREASIGGMPLRLPVIDIHTIGAGGGSIARVDAGGALQVGPHSAGADPGPACYGKGDLPTTTDANLVLGRLHAEHFLGGEMRLDEERARTAITKLAQAMEVDSPEEAALGVVQVANAAMERAIRTVSVARGFDPRDFALVAFGGAGPLHACALAESLQIPQVIIPRAPGTLSAMGMAISDWVTNTSQAVFADEAMLNTSALDTIFAALEARAQVDFGRDGINLQDIRLERGLDMRYVGQSHEIEVAAGGDWVETFHAAHEQRYGYRQPTSAVEAINVRLRAVGITPKPKFTPLETGTPDPARARLASGRVWFSADGPVAAVYYDRARLRAGNRLVGPAVIFQLDATTLIPPGWIGQADKWGHLVLSL